MSLKISPGRADVYHAEGQKNGRTDRQTDMTKLRVVFRHITNAPKKQKNIEF
jgi:hypothetical protein